MSEVNMIEAKATFDSLCKMLDNRGWDYKKFEEDLIIKSGIRGDDFPIDFIVRVSPECEIVSFISWLPFNVSEEKRVDMAIAVCVANYGLVDGSFDYNVADGSIMFRLTSGYKGSTLSDDLLENMLLISAAIIDKYNDKFFMIAKDMMTIQQFIESEQKS